MEYWILVKAANDYDTVFFGEESFKERIASGLEHVTPPGCSGHFDWLRKGEKIVGVRLWPFADNEVDILTVAKPLASGSRTMLIEDGKYISLGFGEGWQRFEEDISQDQDMGDCGLLKFQDGSMAFYFNADGLFDGKDFVKLTS